MKPHRISNVSMTSDERSVSLSALELYINSSHIFVSPSQEINNRSEALKALEKFRTKANILEPNEIRMLYCSLLCYRDVQTVPTPTPYNDDIVAASLHILKCVDSVLDKYEATMEYLEKHQPK